MNDASRKLREQALEIFEGAVLPTLSQDLSTGGTTWLIDHDPSPHTGAIQELARCKLVILKNGGFRGSELAIKVWHGEADARKMLGLGAAVAQAASSPSKLNPEAVKLQAKA